MDKLIKKTINFMVVKLHMNDKHIHALANLVIMLSIGFFNFWLAVGLAIGFSGGKEVGDYFNPSSSGYLGDLLADLVGGIIGILIILFFKEVL